MLKISFVRYLLVNSTIAWLLFIEAEINTRKKALKQHSHESHQVHEWTKSKIEQETWRN